MVPRLRLALTITAAAAVLLIALTLMPRYSTTQIRLVIVPAFLAFGLGLYAASRQRTRLAGVAFVVVALMPTGWFVWLNLALLIAALSLVIVPVPAVASANGSKPGESASVP